MRKFINRVTGENSFLGLLCLFLIFFLLDLIYPLPEMKSFSKVIYAQDGSLLTSFLSDDDKWRMKASLSEVSPELKKAIIEKEDKWFYWHPGFNPVSIIRAFYSNIISGERVSGASTITMQIVRLSEPKDRSYVNKFFEILRALQFEIYYSKKEILEIYLTLLPYGGNIEGVKSASYIYFNRPPGTLSLAQAITLAVIPNNPKLKINENIEVVTGARNELINKFINKKVFPQNDLTDALNEPLKSARYIIPSYTPHFCNFINKKFHEKEIHTWINPAIQAKAESLLKNYIQRVYYKGVTNGAVIIINNKDHSVKGYCGSADHDNFKVSGQVDGVRSIRSPGSTLKPFLYANAFNSGGYTPKMKLLDIPVDYSGYAPENFDQKFNGFVTAEFALINSLNVPAVRLLSETGMDEFESLLDKGGLSSINKDKNKLGLSLILGGCGVTLEQLTRFYSLFANEGELYTLNYIKGKRKGNKSQKIILESTAFIISEILSRNKRPDIPNEYLTESRLPRIAWKTGTSYGKRDAWAIGYSPGYTIGVWIGNFDGKGAPDISGAKIAVPLLFDLFNSIDYDNNNKWFIKPEEVKERLVCSESGLLPGKFCTNITTDFYIENISHNKICNVEREIYVSMDSTIEFCPGCLPDSGFNKAVYRFYQPRLEMWFTENAFAFAKHPSHNPDCNIRFSNEGPVITSPSESFEYYIEKDSDDQILLKAAAANGSKIHYWYINGKFYGKVSANENLFFSPTEGRFKITCMDDMGRDETVFISVKYY